ncbi:MAG TPA: zinc-binding dehydrogenase [Gemmatimonadales bacterium]|nr:zinc-binding dehydrogenase [Gemmatimonadales bacterium]
MDRIEYRDNLPTPEIRGPHDVRIRIRAAALNRLDVFVVGGLPGINITPDWILGSDATGIVEDVGTAVTGVRPGDHVLLNPGLSDRSCDWCLRGEHPLCPNFRILGEHVPGSFADFLVVPEWNVRTIPPSIPSNLAAAFPLATLTAWRMIVTRARVEPRDEVLIWGIGGGVAIAALQICKLIGARVWVTSSSEEKLARARELGADETINHATQDVPRLVRAGTPRRGADVVVDSVGEATWDRSLHALARGGRLVTCGGTSGPSLHMDVRRLFWYQWNILGSTMGNDEEFAAITAELSRGRLLPPIDRVFPMSEGRSAFEYLQSGGQFGKVVLSNE